MGDSITYLQQAITDLKSHAQIASLQVSRFYKSKPHGPQDQPDYLNAVVYLETGLSALELLDFLQKIENNNDRVREGVVRWGARTLDLDLLFYSNEIINSKRLTVPHPRICERAFVLFPMRDLLDDNPKLYSELNEKPSIMDCIDKLSKEEISNIKELALV
ncbi:UNVERIFIED_CONTAM: hypothetical protein GTU68_035215 [Idotea baltica]|nr:hypothetical protein [Idotea baltica]